MYAHVYHLSFFLAFSSFFKIIFLRGNWFKIEQWQRESTWRFACSQETQEPTGEYISRTVKIGCISFMKILLCKLEEPNGYTLCIFLTDLISFITALAAFVWYSDKPAFFVKMKMHVQTENFKEMDGYMQYPLNCYGKRK